jgi:hypothetical protein
MNALAYLSAATMTNPESFKTYPQVHVNSTEVDLPRLAMDKHSSLFVCSANDKDKKFYIIAIHS